MNKIWQRILVIWDSVWETVMTVATYLFDVVHGHRLGHRQVHGRWLILRTLVKEMCGALGRMSKGPLRKEKRNV